MWRTRETVLTAPVVRWTVDLSGEKPVAMGLSHGTSFLKTAHSGRILFRERKVDSSKGALSGSLSTFPPGPKFKKSGGAS